MQYILCSIFDTICGIKYANISYYMQLHIHIIYTQQLLYVTIYIIYSFDAGLMHFMKSQSLSYSSLLWSIPIHIIDSSREFVESSIFDDVEGLPLLAYLRIFWLGIYAHFHKICSSAAYVLFGLAYMNTCIFYAHAKSAVNCIYAICTMSHP